MDSSLFIENSDSSYLAQEEQGTCGSVKDFLKSLLRKNAVKILVIFAATVISSSFIAYYYSKGSLDAINANIVALTAENEKLALQLKISRSELDAFTKTFDEMKVKFQKVYPTIENANKTLLEVVAEKEAVEKTYNDIKLLQESVIKQLDSAKITSINQRLDGISNGLNNSMDSCDCYIEKYFVRGKESCQSESQVNCGLRQCQKKGFVITQMYNYGYNTEAVFDSYGVDSMICCRPCLKLTTQ